LPLAFRDRVAAIRPRKPAQVGLKAVLALVLTACSTGTPPAATAPQSTTPAPATSVSSAPLPPSRASTAPRSRGPVAVRYRIERRTRDAATAAFASTVVATLTDPRGWQRGDVRLVRATHAPYLVVLAEPDEVQRLCQPYDTYRRYSCQNGPVVALNAERWRHATPQWTGSLAAYRQMLVNHEVGHLLGLHHPDGSHCPRRGAPAPVMSQQSTELDGCQPNPWPLPAEVQLLARHVLPLAPPPR
jgi:hypothetical protein